MKKMLCNDSSMPWKECRENYFAGPVDIPIVLGIKKNVPESCRIDPLPEESHVIIFLRYHLPAPGRTLFQNFRFLSRPQPFEILPPAPLNGDALSLPVAFCCLTLHGHNVQRAMRQSPAPSSSWSYTPSSQGGIHTFPLLDRNLQKLLFRETPPPEGPGQG